MTARRTLSVARHEAAHAVVGCYLGLRLKRVAVTPADAVWEGYAYFSYAPAKRLQFGCMCMAGAAGDLLSGLGPQKDAWSGDFALAHAHGFARLECLMLRDLASAYLSGPCARPWASATAALLERDLSGAEVRALVLHGEPLEIE